MPAIDKAKIGPSTVTAEQTMSLFESVASRLSPADSSLSLAISSCSKIFWMGNAPGDARAVGPQAAGPPQRPHDPAADGNVPAAEAARETRARRPSSAAPPPAQHLCVDFS